MNDGIDSIFFVNSLEYLQCPRVKQRNGVNGGDDSVFFVLQGKIEIFSVSKSKIKKQSEWW